MKNKRLHHFWLACTLLLCTAAFAADNHLLYHVQSGDSLSGIAKQLLVDPTRWKEIARLNGIKDPKRLKPRSVLLIPIDQLRLGPTEATVLQTQGKVLARMHNAANAVAVSVGMTLSAGDQLITGEDASVSIGFVDGSKMLLYPNSQLTLSQINGIAELGFATTSVALEKGRMESEVKPQRSKASKYEIRTPTAQLGVRGTRFRTALSSDAILRSEVVEGLVGVANNKGSVNVPSGFGTLVERNTAPLPPVALLPPPTPITNILETQTTDGSISWQAPVGATGYRVQLSSEAQGGGLIREWLLADTSVSWSALPAGKYVLRVRAIDANGLEGSDFEQAIRVQEQVATLRSLSPAVIDGENIEFSWSGDTEKPVRFQLAMDAAFSEPLHDRIVFDRRIRVATPKAGTYFVRLGELDSTEAAARFGQTRRLHIPQAMPYSTWLVLPLSPE